MKTCFKCGVSKPLEDFYRHPQMTDGRLGKCKECCKRERKENQESKREQYSNYYRERERRPERRAYRAALSRKQLAKNPLKLKARWAVNHAIRDGKLKRKPCEHCGTTERVQAHHHDYTKPLEVEWLCFKCHREHAHGQTVTEGQ